MPFKDDLSLQDYWLQLTTGQIKDMGRSPFVTIGSHSYYHNNLSKIDIALASQEMVRSKSFLENLVQKPVNSFAFPDGYYTPAVVKEAKKAGYNQLLAMDFHFEEDKNDPAMRERFTVNPFISPVNQMYATITRRYEK